MQAVKSSVHRISDHRSPEESELWARRDEDPRARDELVSRYLPFARRLAGKYRNRWESADDLQQVLRIDRG